MQSYYSVAEKESLKQSNLQGFTPWEDRCFGGRTDLNPVSVVGVFGEVCAARMTRRNILDAIRAAHRVEGAGRTGAVRVAQGERSVESRESSSELMFEQSVAPFTHAVYP